MASYGIFRVERLKKLSNLRGSLMHSFREQETPNADPTRLNENTLLTPDTFDVSSTLDKYERLKPTGKIRSDVVHALEVLVTASPEKIKGMSNEERNRFFNESLAFCNAKFGEGNLLHAQIHNDETTAHLTAFYIPVIEKKNKKGEIVRKLNASEILGGKKEYSARQTDFYEQVSKKYGLERGEVGSKATHKKVQEWYKELNAESIRLDMPKIIEQLERKSKAEISGSMIFEKKGMFGTKTEEIEGRVALPTPMISIGDVREVLSPYYNSNSEMKRREKQAIKKELEREVKEKLAKERDKIDKLQIEANRTLFKAQNEAQRVKEEAIRETKAEFEEEKKEINQKLCEAEKKEKEARDDLQKLEEFKKNRDEFYLKIVNKFGLEPEYDAAENLVLEKLENIAELEKKVKNYDADLKEETERLEFNFRTKTQYLRRDYELEKEKNQMYGEEIGRLKSENEKLKDKNDKLSNGIDLDTLKEKYYIELEKKLSHVIKTIPSELNNIGRRDLTYKEQYKSFENVRGMLDFAKKTDLNYGLSLEVKYFEQIKKAHDWLVENKHLGNMPGMKM